MKSQISDVIEHIYGAREGSEDLEAYVERHGVQSLGILTVITDEMAGLIALRLEPRIKNKVIVEIGGGIGLLACHLGTYAKRVYCIEANPDWAWAFATALLKAKPKNVSYLFGSADEFAGMFGADVAVVCTHSGLESMKRAALMFAPEVIDVYGEIIESDPEKFDPVARELRKSQ